MNHTRGDILRAILEGIGFYIKDCFLKMQTPFGKIDVLIATGGGSNSEKWLQITADVLTLKVISNTVIEAGSLGAAILTGVGNSIKSYLNKSNMI